MQQIPREIL